MTMARQIALAGFRTRAALHGSPLFRSRSHLKGLSLLVSCPSSAIPLFWLRLSASLISFLHIVGSKICRFVGICPWHTHVAELFAVRICVIAVSYTHLRAHETRHDLVCRLLLEKKKRKIKKIKITVSK